MKTLLLPTLTSGLVLVLATGCASNPKVAIDPPLALKERLPTSELSAEAVRASGPERRLQLAERPIPAATDPGVDFAGMGETDTLPALPKGPPIQVNVEGLPLPAFINMVLGSQLGLNFRMSERVARLTELVTLRASKPQSPTELFLLSRQMLAQYGIVMSIEGELVSLDIAEEGSLSQPPIIASGRALPDVPGTHRPVFYLMQLDVIRANEAAGWLRSIFGNTLKLEENQMRNALMLSGRPDQIRQAVDAMRTLDRPYLRGRSSTRLEPAFLGAEELSNRLVDALSAEGFGASKSFGVPASILVMPIASVNAVLVFASTPESLNRAITWARELDRPNPAASGKSVFYHQVKNTKASDIAAVLGIGSQSFSAAAPNAGGDQVAAPEGSSQRSGRTFGAALTVDAARNALIYQGDATDWERLLGLIHQMDQPARQVMIEVTIAEVSLDDNEEFGVSWMAKGGLGDLIGNMRSGTIPTGGSAPNSPGGITYLLNKAGQNRALLRAFADDQRVNILSTPRLMVKSGHEASIDVGTEVPTITAQTTAAQESFGSTNLLQSIQYRKTGIILRVTPTVYSDDRIDLDIAQEVSEALPLSEGSSIGSPSIFNRAVNTSLSLRDGGSVMIGGLMSHRQTASNSGIPLIKDAPLIGNLFKSQSRRRNKTELVVMIVPYIVESDIRAQEITRAISEKLDLLQLPVDADE